MEYVICILLLPWLAHALYQDWKDARDIRREQGTSLFMKKILRPTGSSDSASGRFLLILGLAAIGP